MNFRPPSRPDGSQGVSFDRNATAIMCQVRWSVGNWQSVPRQRQRAPLGEQCLGGFVGGMADTPLLQNSMPFGEEPVAFEQVELQRAWCRCLGNGNRTPRVICLSLILAPAAAVQRKILGRRPETHGCLLIRQAEERTGNPDSDGSIAIQRQEIDPRPSGMISDIEPDVEFPKIGQPRHGWQAHGSDRIHQKSHNPHVGFPIVAIQRQSSRKE